MLKPRPDLGYTIYFFLFPQVEPRDFLRLLNLKIDCIIIEFLHKKKSMTIGPLSAGAFAISEQISSPEFLGRSRMYLNEI